MLLRQHARALQSTWMNCGRGKARESSVVCFSVARSATRADPLLDHLMHHVLCGVGAERLVSALSDRAVVAGVYTHRRSAGALSSAYHLAPIAEFSVGAADHFDVP